MVNEFIDFVIERKSLGVDFRAKFLKELESPLELYVVYITFGIELLRVLL
jgi:hypothetical protein